MEERTLQLFLGKIGNKWSKVREWGEAEGESVKGGWRELTRHHPAQQSGHTRSPLLFCFAFCDCGCFLRQRRCTVLGSISCVPQYL